MKRDNTIPNIFFIELKFYFEFKYIVMTAKRSRKYLKKA